MRFAKGFLVANKCILDYSVFNLSVTQHIYLTTVLFISYAETVHKRFPCPHSRLASAFPETALVKVPKQIVKDCFQLDAFT